MALSYIPQIPAIAIVKMELILDSDDIEYID
jgi:hypothetical protein